MMPEILFQDEYLLAVNKPHGLLSVPGRGPDKQDCVASRILTQFPDARVVHRLDCYTSGVMLMALGVDMQRALNRLFHDREIEKEYVALVSGEITKQSGLIDVPLRGDPDNRPVQIVDYEHGKAALTHWQLLGYESLVCGRRGSRLRLRPVTGRTHQLRLHCKMLGHPIMGDRLYNPGFDRVVDSRMMLHATVLRFMHPVSTQVISLACMPDFQAHDITPGQFQEEITP